jgi:hypothetical protein
MVGLFFQMLHPYVDLKNQLYLLLVLLSVMPLQQGIVLS